ncbi:TerB family tellurite resistance protein [Rhodovulum sp. DZ06]|uniref:tellurite resistance TerB family protein n=1 Tax=Rhodovulum sp. DZ06 TaxID=3425126 RepID=UPI003D3309CF
MFADLIAWLTAAPEDRDRADLDEGDARLALAALMVRVARADELFDSGERAMILAQLRARYRLPPDAAETLLEEAEKVEAAAPDTVRFTRALKGAVPYEERMGLLEALWAVVLEDGERNPNEDALLRQVAPLLGVTDRDSGIARHRAQAAKYE